MNRRAFVTGLGAVLAAPVGAGAQRAAKVWRIGFAGAGTTSTNQHFLDAFRLGMREHGYVEGENLRIEARWAEGRSERFRDISGELIRLNLDVIVTISTPATQAAKDLTRTIPIVFIAVDPLGTGLVSSLARPGG